MGFLPPLRPRRRRRGRGGLKGRRHLPRGRFYAYGGAICAGPGRTTHRGPHGRELRAAKKRARRQARLEIREALADWSQSAEG